ncbi:MAG: Zn-ribbon domain-containing OB-fold protein [Halobacteria archaeon]|nr:Zn-ribbon domain-containing OB-fold protein [Halobacteria archaeon]
MTVPRFWRRINQRYRLIGTECGNCGNSYYPPRELCPRCRRRGDIVEKEFSGEGEVVSYTVVHEAGEEYDGTPPYVLAVIQLDEGPRVTSQVVDDAEDVEIGRRVEPCFRRIGDEGEQGMIHYGTKFELAEDQTD